MSLLKRVIIIIDITIIKKHKFYYEQMVKDNWFSHMAIEVLAESASTE